MSGDGAVTTAPNGCVVAGANDGTARVQLHADGIATRVEPGDEPVEVRVRAVGDGFTDFPFETLRRGRPRLVELHPIDLGPWDVELTSPGEFRVCPVT